MSDQTIEEIRLKIKELLDESTEANWTVELIDQIWNIAFRCICDRGYMEPFITPEAEGNKSITGMAFILAMGVHARWWMYTYKMEHPEEFEDIQYER